MDMHMNHNNLFERRSITNSKAPTVKWFKEWVPQDVVTTGGKCMILKWVNEATLKALREQPKEPETVEPEPEPTTEVLFLCSFESCGKTFIDAGALRKHSHIHGERQYVCHYEGCGKKFLDSSKLKRHFLIHTGERDFICPHEGCGKAFSLDFNLRSHMKTHSQENYHICPYNDCGKRYAHEYKLKNHISSQHEKNTVEMMVPMPVPVPVLKYSQPPEKPVRTPKASSTHAPVSSDRPFGCPYDGCEKAYIHEYKLKLHLKREHSGHFSDENAKNMLVDQHDMMNEGSDQEVYTGKRPSSKVVQKRSKPKPNLKQLPPMKVGRKGTTSTSANVNVVRKPWPVMKDDNVYEEEDSEETEEDRDNNVEGGAGWRYGENIEDDDDDDDEETEDED